MNTRAHTTQANVIIVGGGLSGLASAYFLHQAGLRVQLLERNARLGGVIQSEQKNGYLIEHGPHTFQPSATELLSLCEALGLQPQPTTPACKNRYIYAGTQLQAVPLSPGAFLKSPLLSLNGKLRILKEFFYPNNRQDQNTDPSVAKFIEAHFGAEVLEQLVGPFLSGVYAGDPKTLSAKAIFPKLLQLEAESGSILKGLLPKLLKKRDAQQAAPRKKQQHTLLNFEQGMATLITALGEALPEDCIHLNTPITELQWEASTAEWHIQSGESHFSAPSVILTQPAHQTATLLQQAAPDLSQLLAQIQYAPLAILHLGIAHHSLQHPLDGFGFLVPEYQNTRLLGCIWSSQLFPGRAPKGHHLLSCFLGGATRPDVHQQSDDALLAETVAQLGKIFGQSAPLNPSFIEWIRYPQAIPQYTQGHPARVQCIQKTLQNYPGLYLGGNYLSGVSLNDCIKQAILIAEALQEKQQIKPLDSVDI